MKKINAVFVFAFLLFWGCKSARFDESGIAVGEWTAGGEKVEKVLVGDSVSLFASVDSEKIPDETPAFFVVSWKAFGRSAILEKIPATVSEGKLFAEWKITDSAAFYEGNEYVIPQYSFVVEAAGETSEESDSIFVYGFIKNRDKDLDGNPLGANEPFTIYRTDGTEIHGLRDADGWIDLKWLPIGKYSLKKAATE